MKILTKIFQIISTVLLLSFFLFFLILLIIGSKIRNDRELYGKNSVGKYISHRHWAKGQTNTVSFNIEGIRYKGFTGGEDPPKDFSENIGKFYKIRYSQKYKGAVETYFEEEVTDTMEILNAGFTRNDILKNDSVFARETTFKEELFIFLDIKN